ncbi:hypothetical protein D3C71_1082430 [compost metagenome]
MLAKALNGTISPLSFFTDQRSKSSGTMRNGWSACTNTRLTRPRSMKSSMYELPHAVARVVLIWSIDRPSELALATSISMRNCGVSSWPFGRTLASFLLPAARPSSWLRAASNASWPWPLLSFRKKV